MDTSKIGKFIAENRKKKNMTQQDLANLLNVGSKTISRWETGRHMPDLSMLLPLSEELEVSVHELLLGEYIEERDLKMKTKQSMETIVTLSQNKTRKRDLLFVSVIGIVLLIVLLSCMFYPTFIKGNVSDTLRVVEKTNQFSDLEIQTAMDKASERFLLEYNCDLKVLVYDEEKYEEKITYWKDIYKEEEGRIMVLGSIFDVGKLGGPAYFEKGKTYIDHYYVVLFPENEKTCYVMYYGNL